MELNSQRFLHLLLFYCLNCLTDKVYSEEQVPVDISGRLARMLCMQYSLEGTFSKSPPQPHKSPLYKAQDAPCRIIHRRVCGGSADCHKFSSKRRRPCDEEEVLMKGEYGEYYGGDIVNRPKGSERGGLSGKEFRWPNRTKIGDDGGLVSPVIPYKFGDEVDIQLEQTMRQAITYIETCTCIRFERKTNKPEHKDWLHIRSTQNGCFSSDLGRAGEEQSVNVDDGCLYGSMIHELLHVIGFDHEHSRPDRDDYVTIVTENIMPENLGNFEKLPKSDWESFKEKYDYSSILHYHKKGFAKKPNLITIETKDSSAYIGQREAMSRSDVIQVNRMYECSDEIRCKTYN